MKRHIIFMLVMLTGAAWSATYYVNNQHAQANDTNPGTETQPLKTIGAAANKVGPGDLVIVKPGTYNETVITRAAGEAGKMITFKADPRRQAKAQRFMMTKAYTRVEGFELNNPGQGTGINIIADNVEAVDNYIYNMWVGVNVGMYKSNCYVARNRIYHCHAGMGVSASNCLVEDNEIERLFDYGRGDCDYSRFFGENITFRGNWFHGTDLNETGSAHVDCWQTFDDNGEQAVNIFFDRNRCGECHQGLMGEANYHGNTNHLYFTNNIFNNCAAWNLCVKNISYIFVYHNVFYNSVHHGTGFSGGWAHHIDIRNNIYYDTGTSYWASDNAQITGDYNIVYQCNNPGVTGAHNKIGVNPQFVNTGAADFHLQSGSPAINAGNSVDVDHDFEDHVRPYNGAPDIGAYEYGSTVTRIAPEQPEIKIQVTRRVFPRPNQGEVFNWLPEDLHVYRIDGRISTVLRPGERECFGKGVYITRANKFRHVQKMVVFQ